MEVVTVSIYVMPVALSLTMQLILMVEIPGVTTSWIGMVPRGASRATSTSSGVCRQTVTLAKPHDRIGGHMSANACTVEEGLGGVGVFSGEARGFTGTVWGSWIDPTFGLKALDGWGISPAATTGQDGCRTFSHPKTLGLSFPRLTLVCRVPWGCQQKGSSDSYLPSSWGGPLPSTPPHQRRRGTTSPPPSSPSHFLLTSLAHLQQADYFPLPNAGGP